MTLLLQPSTDSRALSLDHSNAFRMLQHSALSKQLQLLLQQTAPPCSVINRHAMRRMLQADFNLALTTLLVSTVRDQVALQKDSSQQSQRAVHTAFRCLHMALACLHHATYLIQTGLTTWAAVSICSGVSTLPSC